MVSENGLKSLKIVMSTPVDIDIDTIVLHNVFNKDKIACYTITGIKMFCPVSELKIDQTFMEAVKSQFGHDKKWYQDELTLVSISQFYQKSKEMTRVVYRYASGTKMVIECQFLVMPKPKEIRFFKYNE